MDRYESFNFLSTEEIPETDSEFKSKRIQLVLKESLEVVEGYFWSDENVFYSDADDDYLERKYFWAENLGHWRYINEPLEEDEELENEDDKNVKVNFEFSPILLIAVFFIFILSCIIFS